MIFFSYEAMHMFCRNAQPILDISLAHGELSAPNDNHHDGDEDSSAALHGVSGSFHAEDDAASAPIIPRKVTDEEIKKVQLQENKNFLIVVIIYSGNKRVRLK